MHEMMNSCVDQTSAKLCLICLWLWIYCLISSVLCSVFVNDNNTDEYLCDLRDKVCWKKERCFAFWERQLPQQSSNPLTTRNAARKPDTVESTGARVISHGIYSCVCFVFAIFGRFPSAMLNECYHMRSGFKTNSWINLSYHDYIRAASARHFVCIELSSVGAKQKCEWSSCDCLQRFGPLRQTHWYRERAELVMTGLTYYYARRSYIQHGNILTFKYRQISA